MAAFKSFKGGQVTTGGYVVCNKWSDILKLFQDCQSIKRFEVTAFRYWLINNCKAFGLQTYRVLS